MNVQVQVRDLWESIALDRHGVIEAHAGTGKTYTIVQMVLRMLKNPMPHGRMGRPDLRNILLVTYTEKAAGELRERIRKELAKALKDEVVLSDTLLREHLQRNLDNIEDAWIGTIHSICQRILRAYPFETGLPFATEMQDDRQGTQVALHQVMRGEWSRDALFADALGLLAQEGESFAERELEIISECAAILMDPTARLAEPDYGTDWRTALSETCTQVRICSQQCATLIPSYFEAFEGFLETFRTAGDLNEGLGKQSLEDVQLGAWRERMDAIADALVLRRPDTKLGSAKFGNKALLKAAQKKSSKLFALDEARRVVDEHPFVQAKKELEQLLSGMKRILTCRSVLLTAEHWRKQKETSGLLTFNDLLANARRGVRENENLRKALRAQFCYALIDEFQDTSLLQWDIFRTLFVGDGENPPELASSLYLVGDPKQSIYSFQGANVDTYLAAAESLRQIGSAESLQVNFRSLTSVIEACNLVVAGAQWWMHPHLDYPADSSARAPERPELNGDANDSDLIPWLSRPLRIVPLKGRAAQLRARWANFVALSIRGLRGRKVVLPDGKGWQEPRLLEYNDFAILTETNKDAERFVEALAAAGIPASKYKQEGIFQSEMARQVRIWIEAVLGWETDSSLLGKVLVTALGNLTPQEVALLEPAESPIVQQVVRLLRQWDRLAGCRNWARLIRSLLVDSKVEESLLRLADGDRRVSDLRQVLEHCHTFLDEGGHDLSDLVEHLRDLAEKRVELGREGNLHQKESDLKAVQVMTMHASKGLQFPVVYLATRGASVPRSPRVVRWVSGDSDDSGLRCYPHLESTWEASGEQQPGSAEAKKQGEQERKRLYYVALTRAQLLLFVPCNQKVNKSKVEFADTLSEKIKDYLDVNSGPICSHDENCHLSACAGNVGWEIRDSLRDLPALADPQNVIRETADAVSALKLPIRSRRQESYTSLTHATSAGARDVDSAQEPGEQENVDNVPEPLLPTGDTDVLPRGKHIGIAWHGILETFLREQNLNFLLDEPCRFVDLPDRLRSACINELRRNGVYAAAQRYGIDEERVQEATWSVCRAALVRNITWTSQGNTFEARLCALPAISRLPEVEFHLRTDDENLLGFMDLVIRLPLQNDISGHPYRYFVLDWKSNRLENYGPSQLVHSVYAERYDDQARLYCHALDVWLRSRLGERYDAKVHLGGALYVYLRGLTVDSESVPTWFHPADPFEDTSRVLCMLRELKSIHEEGRL